MGKWAIGLVGLLAVLVACGTVAGDPERGRKIYTGETPVAAQAPACVMCHPVNVGEQAQVMGQNLSNIGNRAASRVPGQSAEEYLRTAIVQPNAFLAGGFQEGIMYGKYQSVLTPQQINDLVAYMLTLKSGQD